MLYLGKDRFLLDYEGYAEDHLEDCKGHLRAVECAEKYAEDHLPEACPDIRWYRAMLKRKIENATDGKDILIDRAMEIGKITDSIANSFEADLICACYEVNTGHGLVGSFTKFLAAKSKAFRDQKMAELTMQEAGEDDIRKCMDDFLLEEEKKKFADSGMSAVDFLLETYAEHMAVHLVSGGEDFQAIPEYQHILKETYQAVRETKHLHIRNIEDFSDGDIQMLSEVYSWMHDCGESVKEKLTGLLEKNRERLLSKDALGAVK